MPMGARDVAAIIGGLMVVAAWSSVIGTLIVSRSISGTLTRAMDRAVITAYRLVTHRITDYYRRDRVLSTQAAAILVAQLIAWIALTLVGFALLMWPFAPGGLGQE